MWARLWPLLGILDIQHAPLSFLICARRDIVRTNRAVIGLGYHARLGQGKGGVLRRLRCLRSLPSMRDMAWRLKRPFTHALQQRPRNSKRPGVGWRFASHRNRSSHNRTHRRARALSARCRPLLPFRSDRARCWTRSNVPRCAYLPDVFRRHTVVRDRVGLMSSRHAGGRLLRLPLLDACSTL